MREYRQRKKAALGEEWLEKERKRIRSYYKPVDQLSSKDRKKRREKMRVYVVAYRERQKLLKRQRQNNSATDVQDSSRRSAIDYDNGATNVQDSSRRSDIDNDNGATSDQDSS
jgi:hypothetical protein